MSSLSCLRGSQACLNCLLASKPLICKLAPLVLSPSLCLSVSLSVSLCVSLAPSPSLFALYVRLCLSSYFVCMPLFCPPPSPLCSPLFPLSVFPLTVSFCQFSAMMHTSVPRTTTLSTSPSADTHTRIVLNHTTVLIAMLRLPPHLRIATRVTDTACPPVAHT